MISGTWQKRHLMAAVTEEFVRITVTPILLDERAESQILDARAASVEKARQSAGFGQPPQRPGRDIYPCLQIGAEVRRAQAHDVADGGGPPVMLLHAVKAGTATRPTTPGGRNRSIVIVLAPLKVQRSEDEYDGVEYSGLPVIVRTHRPSN